MKSKYAIRIYELLVEELKNANIYADKHREIEISLELIRKVTGTEKKLKQIGELKKRCLQPAIEEINHSKVNWHVEYSNIKKGRNIVGFKFDIWSAIGFDYINNTKIIPELENEQLNLFEMCPESIPSWSVQEIKNGKDN